MFTSLYRALARSSRRGLRLLQFSVQSDHIHAIVEADSSRARVRGLQGLAIRCAGASNPTAAPRTWLATVGWRRGGGTLDFAEAPR